MRNTLLPTRVPFAVALFAGALALVTCLQALAQAQRGPSTEEERKRFVAVTRELIRAPLSANRDDARWALTWLSEVPDIVVNPCPVPLENLTTSGHKHTATIWGIYVLAMGAFTVEQPEKAKDPAEQFMAGVDAAIRTYQTILRAEPDATSADMDDLVARRKAGTLQGFVQEASRACTTPEGGSRS